MKKNLFLFIIIVLASGTSFATSGSVFLWHREAGASTQAFPTFPKRPFDVKSYNLTLDWRKPFVVKSQQFSGKNIITLRLTDAGTTSIVLDAALLVIDTVFVGSQHILPTPQPDTNEQITIPLATAFRQDTADLIISISYHRTDVSSRGAFFYPKNTFVGLYRNVDSIFTTEDIIYTMSEPLDAHAWMPCMDLPYDKADYEVSIIVPNGITTASNGALLAKTSVDANSTLWHWKSDRPMSTYLMVADASNFIQWGETHHRSSDPADTVSLVYYAWPADYYQDSITDGSKYNAKHSFRNTSWIMSNYESRYGPYPFEKYGQVPAQRFDFGGQEHQTLTTINRSWLRNNEQGMAHEMSHHWFGDKVTCETFKDIWLNEGFATFSEAIWYEGWGGYSNYIGNIRSDALQYFSSAYSDVPIYDPPGADDMFNLGSTVLYYPKAACVIHMLRRIIRNDTMFFAALRDYTDHFAYSTATTDEFRDFMSARLGIDLTEFIDEWIYGPGHVKYAITWGQSKSGFLMINVAQGQSWRDHFTMPLQFFAYHGKLVDTLRFTNNARTQEFFAGLPYKLDSLGFDTDALVLSEYTVAFDPALGVQSALATDDLGGRTVFDRSNNSLICDLNTPAQNDDRLELYNLLGVKLKSTLLVAGQTDAKFSVSDLPDGLYFVRYISGKNQFVIKSQIVR